MLKAPAALLVSLALTGCAVAPQARLAADPAFRPAAAWDGAGEDGQPRQTEHSGPARIAARPSQPLDASDQDAEDAQLAQSLVICKGCLRPQPIGEARLAKAAE